HRGGPPPPPGAGRGKRPGIKGRGKTFLGNPPMLLSWLSRRQSPAKRPAYRRLELEPLEGRLTPTSGAHFFHDTAASVAPPPSSAPQAALVVTIDEAGVGPALVNTTLTADASATYACINGGGNPPKATNKETVNGPLSAELNGVSPINGRVMTSIMVGPLGPGDFSCPPGQTMVLASV